MSKFFGGETDGWNIGEEGSGKVGIGTFSAAIQVWSIHQCKPTCVAAAAEAFNVPPAMVIEAVEWHPWMFLSGPAPRPLLSTTGISGA